MKLENNLPYKVYSKIEIKEIQDCLTSLNSKLWEVDKSRQAFNQGPHNKTRSLIIQYCRGEPKITDNSRSTFTIPTVEDFYKDIQQIEEKMVHEDLNKLTKSIILSLENQFNGVSALVLYTKLGPGKDISPHRDPGYYLSVVHRLHIPIFTNENCYFHLDDTSIHMEEGRLYEINNLMNHSVENKGDSDRVHLIVDIIPNSILRTIETSL